MAIRALRSSASEYEPPSWRSIKSRSTREGRLASMSRLFNLSVAMPALDSFRSCILDSPHSKESADFGAERKQELGQFLTPEAIGTFMASLFEAHPAEIRLL